MDLYAYTNIGKLEHLAKLNNIDVPRLRGYRLMSEEEPLTSAEIDDLVAEMVCEVYHRGCCSIPRFCPDSNMSEFSSKTDRISAKYLDVDGKLRWNLIHGKSRKRMKFAVKKIKRAAYKQYNTFSKYAGRNDVLYIHARIGGDNWYDYKGYLLEKEPWFLERVDDCYDETYCDIYAKLNKTE